MLINFIANRAGVLGGRFCSNAAMRGMSAMCKGSSKMNISEGQAALNHVSDLYKKGQYREVLKEIVKIEERYPGCSKAAKYYRGEAAYALLEQTGELKKLTPSI